MLVSCCHYDKLSRSWGTAKMQLFLSHSGGRERKSAPVGNARALAVLLSTQLLWSLLSLTWDSTCTPWLVTPSLVIPHPWFHIMSRLIFCQGLGDSQSWRCSGRGGIRSPSMGSVQSEVEDFLLCRVNKAQLEMGPAISPLLSSVQIG